ncbi:hypothetical protein K445DRAFT_363462 [Daldinia sp. EC12]|nr:hypothetical protein K445DRAFT_363462 [Daldinia sp. EC12]
MPRTTVRPFCLPYFCCVVKFGTVFSFPRCHICCIRCTIFTRNTCARCPRYWGTKSTSFSLARHPRPRWVNQQGKVKQVG